MKKLKIAFVVLMSFFLIYYPPVVLMSTIHYLAVFAFLYIIVIHRTYYFSKTTKYIQLYIFYCGLISTYIVMTALANGVSAFSAAYGMITIMIEIIPIAHAISLFFIRSNLDVCFYDILLISGTLQGIISMASFFIPTLHNLIINQMLSYGFNDVIIKMARLRMFGWSYTMAFAMPVVQALLALLALYIGRKKNAKYYFYIPLLLFSSIINARTGLVVFGIGAIFVFLDLKQASMSMIVKTIAFILVMIIFINLGSGIIEKYSPETYEWLRTGILDIFDFTSGNSYSNTSYFNYVTDSSKFELPNGLAFFFGTGKTTTRANSLMTSDIGFVNDFWLGGLFYIVMIFLLYKKMIYNAYRYVNIKYDVSKIIMLGFVVVLLICNIKGRAFSFNEISNLIVLSSVYCTVRMALEREGE